MEIKKEMSIKELFDEMQFLKARLIKLAEKYNKSLITVSAINWKDIIVGGGRKGDIMLNKEIKKEEMLNEFDIVKASYDDYKNQAVEKIKDMIANKSVAYCIVYFRDTLKWKWEDISKLFNYSRIQCIRLYKKEKMIQDDTQ